MNDDDPIRRAYRAKRLLSLTAWVMLSYVALGYMTLVPSVNRLITQLEATSVGRILEGLVFLGLVVTAGALWWAAIAHVRSTISKGLISRSLLVGVLAVTNFVGAFFNYFAHVVWQRPAGPATDSSQTTRRQGSGLGT